MGETTLSADGEVLGTAGYWAPEQVAGRSATSAADRFALGVVAYQLLTGRLRRSRGRELAASVESVFDRALAEAPDRRYPTASAFVDALGEALASDPAATVVGPTRRRLIPLRTTPGVRPAPSLGRHTQRSRLWRTAAFLLAALAVAAPATAGGMVLGQKLARMEPAHSQLRRLATRCAVSKFGADANLVVSGVGAIAFCRSQAETLSAQGDAWAYRSNPQLLAPDSGEPNKLGRVCALARGRLTAAVYDDLGRKIGTDLCHAYAAAGWELRT